MKLCELKRLVQQQNVEALIVPCSISSCHRQQQGVWGVAGPDRPSRCRLQTRTSTPAAFILFSFAPGTSFVGRAKTQCSSWDMSGPIVIDGWGDIRGRVGKGGRLLCPHYCKHKQCPFGPSCKWDHQDSPDGECLNLRERTSQRATCWRWSAGEQCEHGAQCKCSHIHIHIHIPSTAEGRVEQKDPPSPSGSR